MDLFWQNWLYSGKNCCNRVRRLYSGKSGCIRAEWLYSGKIGYIPKKVVVFGQKVVKILQSGFILAGFFVFGQNWLY